MKKSLTYAERLMWALNERHLTQSELARRVHIRPQAIQYLCDERNHAQGSKHTAAMAKALGVSPDWLANQSGTPFLMPTPRHAANLTAENTQSLSDFFAILDAQQPSFDSHLSPKNEAHRLAESLFDFLFPSQSQGTRRANVHYFLLQDQLRQLLEPTMPDPEQTAADFCAGLPTIYQNLLSDAEATLRCDPAATTHEEVVLTYPGFFAIAIYRLAHALAKLNVPLLPRLFTEYAHSKTGIDIHPSAKIGASFFIDHGTGIVIGATCVIGEHVKIYQGVTLGALQVEKTLAKTKRHPSIEDHVTLYANATILGGDTVIGKHSIIGGNVWLTHSVPAYARVYHEAKITVRQPQNIQVLNFQI